MSQSLRYRASSFLATLCVILLSTSSIAAPSADNGAATGAGSETAGNQPDVAGMGGGQAEPRTPEEIINRRLNRQRRIINNRLQNGFLTGAQAKKFNSTVDDIQADFQQLKGSSGVLKEEDVNRLTNALNQNANELRSTATSGTSVVQGANALGPEWSKGPDGAQNPRTLLQEMRQEHQREMRQEKQSNEQKLEMQQQDYEREMVESLGEQRGKILKKKEELKEVREESGAN